MVASSPGRLSALRAPASDFALVLFIQCVGVAGALHGHRTLGGWPYWVITQFLVLPLLARRFAPVAAFCVIVAAALVQWSIGGRWPQDIALLVALYSVAVREERRTSLLAAGALEIGVVLASARFSPAGVGVIASLVFLSSTVVAALFTGLTVHARRDQMAELRDRAARLEREREREMLLAATSERNRIARELHDVVAHSLSVITLLADGAVMTDDPSRAHDAMRNVAATSRSALGEMRRLLGVLRTDGEGSDSHSLVPQPGLEHLIDLVSQMRATGMVVHLAVSGEPRSLPPTVDAAAYRVVQEALTNCLKHAPDASVIKVTLEWKAAELVVKITDDGGTPAALEDSPGEALPAKGYGLSGMRERVELFGGTMGAGPSSEGGWKVVVALPMSDLTTTTVP